MRSFLAIVFFTSCLLSVSLAGNTTRTKMLFDRLMEVYGSVVPSGTYSGSTSVLGQSLGVTIDVIDSTTASLKVSGVMTISCPSEAYTYANSVITVTNINDPTDCVYQALSKSGASIQSITFFPESNDIVCKLRYSFLTLSVKLNHQNAPLVPRAIEPTVAVASLPLSEIFDKYFVVFSLQDPAGTYKGSKSILGETFNAVIVINSATSFDFAVSGGVTVNCSNEAYTYSNGVITVTNISKSGDCIHDALQTYGASLQGISYDTSSNTINIKIKYDFISVDFVLDHQN